MADGAGVRAVTSNTLTVKQTSHRLVCDALRRVLRGPGAVEEIGSILYRVSAVVYTLLLDHPIDRRGRCRSCRRPGTIIGRRRRPCRIHLKASYWLLCQPDQAILLSHLADDLGLGTAPGAGTPPDRSSRTTTAPIDLSDTEVPAAVVDEPSEGRPRITSGGSLAIPGGMPWPR